MAIDLDNLDQSIENEESEKLSERIEMTQSFLSEIKNKLNQKSNDHKNQLLNEYTELAEEYERVKDKLMEFPGEIEFMKETISGYEDAVEEAKEELELIESTMMMEISNAKTDDGKKKYPNKNARQSALKQKKSEDEEYQQAKKELKEAKKQLEQHEFELDKIYNQFKSYRRTAGMLEARMNLLAGVGQA